MNWQGWAEIALTLGLAVVIGWPLGVYLARVIDRKESQGETFLIVDGGLNHHLAATGNFGTVVRRNYPAAIATKFAADR